MTCDCCHHIPDADELHDDKTESWNTPAYHGPTPDHKAGWACCDVPVWGHLSAADLEQADRNREAGRHA